MNDERQRLYEYMGTERVNVEIMFARPDDDEPIITCRLREWSAGRNAQRMILAGGRTVDEAIAYAYTGLLENNWIPLDWRVRAPYVGAVYGVVTPPVPIRRPIALNAILAHQPELFPIDDPSWRTNVPQQGAQEQPQRKSSKDKGQQTAG